LQGETLVTYIKVQQNVFGNVPPLQVIESESEESSGKDEEEGN